MPAEPDKQDIIIALQKQALANDELILAALAKGAGTGTGPAAPAEVDPVTEFKARWAVVTPEQFQQRYGVAYGQPIPPLENYDEDEVIFRSRAFYDVWEGKPGYGYGFPPEQIADIVHSIDVIAHANKQTANNFYECGKPLATTCYPDTLAYSFFHGLIKTWKQFTEGFMVGPEPYTVSGLTLEEKAAKPGSGKPGA